MAREHDLALAVVEVADALVSDFDAVDLLPMFTSRCVELLGVHAVALMLPDERGQLQATACSSDQAHLLARFELKIGEGPCLGSYRAGRPVSYTNLDRPDPRWPGFSERARRDEFSAIHALPLRQHEDIIGVLGLFSTTARPIGDGDVRIGQALAKVAAVAVLRQRRIQHLQVVAEQLRIALCSRVLIEQAKGVVAERFKVDMSTAFDTLRDHARRTNLQLSDLAQSVIEGAVEADRLARNSPPRQNVTQTPAVMRCSPPAAVDVEKWERAPAVARPVPTKCIHRRTTAMYEIHIHELPEQKVVCLQRRVFINDYFNFLQEEHAIIRHIRECGAEKSGSFMVIYHGQVTEVSDGPVELCVPYTGTVEPAGAFSVRVEMAHHVAYTTVIKREVVGRRNQVAHEAVQQWLTSHGHVMTAPPRDVYIAWNAIGDDEGACEVAYPFDGGTSRATGPLSPRPGQRR